MAVHETTTSYLWKPQEDAEKSASLFFYNDTHSRYSIMKRKMELQKLGERIKSLRTKRNMTQGELALACKFNRNYIGMLERGERNPTYITLLKLASNLGMPLSKLIG